MISAKSIAFFLLIVTLTAFGLGEEFSETAPLVPGQESNINSLVNDLKQQAVNNRLKEMLGTERFAGIEKQVTKEFADRYIVDYKSRRVGADRSQLEVTGHFDLDGLKRWARLVEAKSKGAASPGNIFILSSTVPGIGFSSSQTAQRVRDSQVAQAILSAISPAVQKIHQKLLVVDTGRISLSNPPRQASEIKTLADQVGGQPGAVWAQMVSCKSCGGMRLDTYFYQLSRSRLALLRSDDIAMGPTELANIAKLKGILKNVTTGLQSELEGALSSGGLGSQAIELTVEGIENFQGFRGLREQLEKLDYLNQITMVKAESKSATFEALSSLSPEELASRLGQEGFTGFHLKTQSVDSRAISVRYLP